MKWVKNYLSSSNEVHAKRPVYVRVYLALRGIEDYAYLTEEVTLSWHEVLYFI